MSVWRETHPIWLSEKGTWKIRGGPPTVWEGVFPPDRAWHWTFEPTPKAVWHYVTPAPTGWRWLDTGLHPTPVPVGMPVTSPYQQLPWNVQL